MPDTAAEFVLNAHEICLGSSMLFFVLAIAFAVTASNQASTYSTLMLTKIIRIPTARVQQEVLQLDPHQQTVAFESQSMGEQFRIPFLQSSQRQVQAQP